MPPNGDPRARMQPENSPADSQDTALEIPVTARRDIQPERSHLTKFRFFFRHSWIVGVSLALGLLISVGYVMQAVPIYQSTIVLQVAEQQVRNFTSDSSSGNGNDDLRGDDILNTITQSLKLDSLYERVANEPAINQDPSIVPAIANGGTPPSPEALAIKINASTTVTLRRGTRLIDVSVESPVPAAAQKLATAVIEEFVQLNAEKDISTSSAKRKFLLDEVDRAKTNLQKSEDGLQVYKEALRMKQQVDDQQKVVDDLSQRYLDAHPRLIEARSLLADLRRNFDTEIKKVIANSPVEAAYWNQNPTTQGKQTQDDIISQELKQAEARTTVLQSEVNTESALFDSLLKQMREQDVQTEAAPIQVKVVDPAKLPKRPVRPDSVIVIRNGTIAGLVIGIILVFILQRFDSTFASAEEVEQLTELPVIAAIPLVGQVNTAKLPRLSLFKRTSSPSSSPTPLPGSSSVSDDIILIKDPGGVVAENVRNLWASLELVGKEADRRTILFSSALPGEGKTFTSCNYAVSVAQHGLKTLLIDADLRRPSVHTRFLLKNNRPGLTEHVAKGLPLDEVVHKNVIENLDIMLTGGKCPNPSEFFGGKGFAEILQKALATYDRVVVDSPPIIVVSDTRLIAPYIQTVCLVIKAESTSRYAVKRALNFLDMVNVRPVGIIYNCISSWSIDEYYGYSYSKEYKYGDVYRSKD